MINAKTTDIPIPVTRTEHFMYSAITGNESGLKANTQAEMYLDAIKNSDTSDLEGLEPRTVLDMYLEARQTGVVDDLPKPRTTSEMLLYQAITGEDLGAKPVSNMDKYLSLLEPNNYDARLEIESESSTIKLTDSKNGVIEVKELEGNTLVNLFDSKKLIGQVVHGVITNSSLAINNAPGWTKIGLPLDCKVGSTYTLIANVGDYVELYTRATHSINGSATLLFINHNNTEKTLKVSFVATSQTHTICFECDTGVTTSYEDIIVLEGDWTNKEIPEYFEGMKSVGECEDNKIEVVSQNKNFFDVNKIQIRNDSTYGYMYLGESDKYTISITDKDTSVDMSWVYFGFTGNGKDASNGVHWVMDNGNVLITKLTSYDNLKYFSFYPNNQETLNKITSRFNVQIEEGIVATSYVPYATNTKEITLSEPLRGVGDVKDRFVFKDGKLMVERNFNKLILDGSIRYPDWHQTNMYISIYPNANDKTTCYRVCNIPNKALKWQSTISNMFTTCVTNEAFGTNAREGYLSDHPGLPNIYFCIGNTNTLTMDDFYRFISENPIEMVYQLAEPTYEEITPELQKLILKCYDNATLFFNTNIPPKSLISYTANTSNIYRYLDTLKLSKEECDSIINSMERV